MPRIARIVVPGAPHHVTQRGNRRQTTFFSADDYRLYLRLAAAEFRKAGVEVWAYCLMPNHVHLIAKPDTQDGLAVAVGQTHLRYSRRINERQGWTGHLWQGRFASFPMDEARWVRCAAYVGLNPVRAGLVRRAVDWPWSSVRAHIAGERDLLLTTEPLVARLGSSMAEFFDRDVGPEELSDFRAASAAGRLGAIPKVRVAGG